MYQGEKSYWMKHLDFMLLDLLWTETAYFLALFIKNRGAVILTERECRMALMLLVVFWMTMIVSGCYHDILRRGYYREMAATVKQVFLQMVLTGTFLFLLKSGLDYSRFVWLLTWFFDFLLVYCSHLFTKRFVIRLKGKNRASISRMVVFVTRDNAEKDLAVLLDGMKYEDYEIEGVVVIDQDLRGSSVCGVPVVGYRSDALEYVRTNVVDEVFLHFTDQGALHENLTQYFRRMGITVHVYLMEQPDLRLHNESITLRGGFLVASRSIRIASPLQLFLKRCMDIAGGLVGTLITGILFLIFGPIIYIQSPGPVFFSQTRIGKNGRKFKIYKFRSMYPDAEERKKELMAQNKMNGLMFKMDDDPRIIPIGKFLRNTSLDEFPQFWNVLKGDMSLVGTRPPTEDEYICYEDYHKRRLATKPGITGMWQVSGRSDITEFEDVVALDSQYIENWNIGLDIRILLKTVVVVLQRKGSE